MVYAAKADELDSRISCLAPKSRTPAYKNPDNDPRGVWKTSDLSARNYYSAGTYSDNMPIWPSH